MKKMNKLFNTKVWNKIVSKVGDVNMWENIMETYIDEVHNNNRRLKPTKRKNYVGIEIECFSYLNQSKVMALILNHGLENCIHMADDSSIEAPGCENTYEFRILSTETGLPKLLKKLDKFFKEGRFKTNNSCGLHVHLDMRQRNVDACYEKLLKFQDVMYGLVKSKRWYNDYCQYSKYEYFNRRHSAINRTAYSKHKTLEVRLHHGTTDVKEIQNWVNLLLKAIGKPSIPEIKSKDDALKWAGKSHTLKSYIKKTFNSRWFLSKSRVLERFYPMSRPYTGLTF